MCALCNTGPHDFGGPATYIICFCMPAEWELNNVWMKINYSYYFCMIRIAALLIVDQDTRLSWSLQAPSTAARVWLWVRRDDPPWCGRHGAGDNIISPCCCIPGWLMGQCYRGDEADITIFWYLSPVITHNRAGRGPGLGAGRAATQRSSPAVWSGPYNLF